MYLTGILIKIENNNIVIDYKDNSNENKIKKFKIQNHELEEKNLKIGDYVYLNYKDNKVLNIGLVDNLF